MLLRILYPFEGVVESKKVLSAAADAIANGYDGEFDGMDLGRAIEIVEDAGLYTFTQRTVERHGAYKKGTVERV